MKPGAQAAIVRLKRSPFPRLRQARSAQPTVAVTGKARMSVAICQVWR